MRKLIYTGVCIFFASAATPHLAETFEIIPSDSTTQTRDDQIARPKSGTASEAGNLPATATLLGNRKVRVGDPYVDFVASTLTGEEVRFSAMVGAKATLLHFWGIRCPPCMDEFALLIELQRRYGDQGLQVIGVNTDRVDADRLARTMVARKLDPPYPIVLDPDLHVSEQYTNHFVPISVLIDEYGMVQAVFIGYNKLKSDKLIVKKIKELIDDSTTNSSDVLGARENKKFSLPIIPNG